MHHKTYWLQLKIKVKDHFFTPRDIGSTVTKSKGHPLTPQDLLVEVKKKRDIGCSKKKKGLFHTTNLSIENKCDKSFYSIESVIPGFFFYY